MCVLAHGRAEIACVLQKNLVKLGASNLESGASMANVDKIGVSLAFVLVEFDSPARLYNETVVTDLVQGTDKVEKGGDRW